MPPSASTLTKGSWAPDTRLVPSIPQNTVANGWKNETTATAPLSMGSKVTGGLSRAERLWVLADLTANTKNCGRITLNPIQTLQSEFVVTLDFRPLADTPFL